MIIRKKFSFEGAHIVRNCSTKRCRSSAHGHSYVVEVFMKSSGLDNGMMVYDFGLMKGTIKEVIDAFDHTYVAWTQEEDEFREFMKKHSERYIELPVSPSAESLSLILLGMIRNVMSLTQGVNGEKDVEVFSVRVHETTTGYAQSFVEDLQMLKNVDMSTIFFSNAVVSDFTHPELYNVIKDFSSFDKETPIFVNKDTV